MSRRSELGRPSSFVPSTRIHNAPGGASSFNLFSAAADAPVLAAKSTNPIASTNNNSGAFAEDPVEKPSVARVRAAPGGASSLGSLLTGSFPAVDENVPARNSTRVMARPGGVDSVSNLFSYTPEETQASAQVASAPEGNATVVAAQQPRSRAASRSSIFGGEDETQVPRSSTRLLNAPGGKDHMSAIMGDTSSSTVTPPRSSTRLFAAPAGAVDQLIAGQAPPPEVKASKFPQQFADNNIFAPADPNSNVYNGIRSYKTNLSHNVLPGGGSVGDASATSTGSSAASGSVFSPQPRQLKRTGKMLKSRAFAHVNGNVGGGPASPETERAPCFQRTYKTNMCSEEPEPCDVTVGQAKHATHNKMMQSNIFASSSSSSSSSDSQNQQPARSSVRRHQVPGGASQIQI